MDSEKEKRKLEWYEAFANGVTIGAWLTDEELRKMGPKPWIILLIISVILLSVILWIKS